MEISDGYRDLLINLMSTNDLATFNYYNQLFYNESRITIYEEFRQLVKTGFDNGELVLDFNDPDAVIKINQWAAESTNDRIKHLKILKIQRFYLMLMSSILPGIESLTLTLIKPCQSLLQIMIRRLIM